MEIVDGWLGVKLLCGGFRATHLFRKRSNISQRFLLVSKKIKTTYLYYYRYNKNREIIVYLSIVYQ